MYVNLDERYLSYLQTDKKFSIDGVGERVKSYGYHCDGNEIKGHYVITENHKLYYDLDNNFKTKERVKQATLT
tara:strand:+ start:303 stop:521 length:219 start_codon:yes stop_codon:yes gene_type:complete